MLIYQAQDRTPYTYLIGWSNHNKYYYGVRFAKGCHPSDLWNPYKTSSKHVKRFIEECGDPDILIIRKTFFDIESARIWEENVLTRLKVVDRSDFLNKTANKSIPPGLNLGCKYTEESKRKMSEGQKARGGNGPKKHSEETKRKMSEKRKGHKPALGSKWTEEQKLKQSILLKSRWNNQYTKGD